MMYSSMIHQFDLLARSIGQKELLRAVLIAATGVY